MLTPQFYAEIYIEIPSRDDIISFIAGISVAENRTQ